MINNILKPGTEVVPKNTEIKAYILSIRINYKNEIDYELAWWVSGKKKLIGLRNLNLM